MAVYDNFNFRSLSKSQIIVDKSKFDASQKTSLHARLTLAATNGETVCAVGDSITYSTSSWDDILFARYPGVVKSADMGIEGNTSNEVLARIATILATNADFYMLAVGCNDIRHNNVAEPRSVTVESYIATMASIVNAMTATGADVYILTIWPSWHADQSPATTNVYGDYTKTNNQIDARNAALRKWCIDNNVGFINTTAYLRSVITTEELEQTYSNDGIHPNTAGKTLYADACLNNPV